MNRKQYKKPSSKILDVNLDNCVLNNNSGNTEPVFQGSTPNSSDFDYEDISF